MCSFCQKFTAPMGLTRSPPPSKECMVLAGNFINTAITQAKETAKPLQINIKASDSVAKYSEILRRAPERVASWKASCARAGARMSLSMVKAHYEDADIDTVTSGRRSTLYPHDTIPSCCHQWPTGLVLTKMEYWQTESVTKSFQKVLPYIIASLSSAPMKHSRSPCPVTKDNVWFFLM